MSELRRAYDDCRRLNAAHGRTYYLATLLLPAYKRPAVHALVERSTTPASGPELARA